MPFYLQERQCWLNRYGAGTMLKRFFSGTQMTLKSLFLEAQVPLTFFS